MTIPIEWIHLSPGKIVTLLAAQGVTMTRQGVTQALRRQTGMCVRCGKKATVGVFCKKHYAGHLKTQRARTGHRPWRPGSRGRPPITAGGAE